MRSADSDGRCRTDRLSCDLDCLPVSESGDSVLCQQRGVCTAHCVMPVWTGGIPIHRCDTSVVWDDIKT